MKHAKEIGDQNAHRSDGRRHALSRKQTSAKRGGAASSKRESARTRASTVAASARWWRRYSCSPARPYERSTNQSLSARKRRPNGTCQSCRSTETLSRAMSRGTARCNTQVLHPGLQLMVPKGLRAGPAVTEKHRTEHERAKAPPQGHLPVLPVLHAKSLASF